VSASFVLRGARSEIIIIDFIHVICYDVMLCLTIHEACMLAEMLYMPRISMFQGI